MTSKRLITWSITLSMGFVLGVIGLIKETDLSGLSMVIGSLAAITGMYTAGESYRESSK